MTSANPRMAECDRKAARHTWVWRVTRAVLFVPLFYILAIVFTASVAGG